MSSEKPIPPAPYYVICIEYESDIGGLQMLEPYRDAYRYSMAAKNLSKRTQEDYLGGLDCFERWLDTAATSPPASVRKVTRVTIEAWMAWLGETYEGNTPKHRYSSSARKSFSNCLIPAIQRHSQESAEVLIAW
jgi:site-specific recombinase XerD